MPQGGFRGAEELGTGTRSGDKPTKRKPLKADATLYRPNKGGFTGFDGDQSAYGRPEVSDPIGLSKAQNDELNASARRSEQMAAQVAQAAAIGGNVGTRANRLVNAGPATPPTGPLQQESATARDRLRMQIANEQRALLDARRAGKMVKGSEQDATSLANIAALRREMAGYDSAARPVQAPSSPERNFMANRDVAGQAAKIMQGDLAAMEQRVYTMPPGPAKDAELEKIRAFKSKTSEQFVRGNVLRPEDTGPAVEGASATGYYDALATADKQTASQVAAASRDYDRRQNVLGFTKDITAKRLAEEQRTKDMTTAVYNAGMAGIRRPEDEFKMKQDAMAAEIANIQAKTGVSRADAEKIAAQTEVARESISPNNIDNRLKATQIDAMTSEMARRNKVASGELRPQTPEEIAAKREQDAYARETSGVTEQGQMNAMKAASDFESVSSFINSDGVAGSTFTGNADGAVKASSQILNYAQSLADLARTDPQAARVAARDFYSNIRLPSSGKFVPSRGAGNIAANMVVGLPTLGLGNVAMEMAHRSNAAARQRAADQMNNAIELLKQIAGQ